MDTITHQRPSTVLSRVLNPEKGVGKLDTDHMDVSDDEDIGNTLDLSGELAPDLEFSDDDSMPEKRKRSPENDGNEPPRKKSRLKKHKSVHATQPEESSRSEHPLLSAIVFDEEDFAVAPSEERAPAVEEQQEASEDNDNEPPPRVTEITVTMKDGLPLLGATTRSVTCRCVFSSQTYSQSAFKLINKDTAVPYNFARQPWAVMAKCGAGDYGKASGKQDPDTALSRVDEKGDKPPAEIDVDTPWFVLVGKAALSFVCSPFFTYELSMTQFDPDSVLFKPNPTAPIYYLLSVLSKEPIFSGGNVRWDHSHIINTMRDTLYAHSLLKTGNEDLTFVLRTIDRFDQAEDPCEKPVGNKSQSLNRPDYSERKDRVKKLKKIIAEPCKKQFDAFTAGNRAEVLVSCSDLRSLQNVLFLDLEKPKIAFRLLSAGMPIETLSSVSHWKDADERAIRTSVNNLVEAMRYGKTPAGKNLYPASVAKTVRLDPEWFARYYQWLCDERSDSTRFKEIKSRLAAYRTFIASDIYHDIIRNIDCYGNHVNFLFTRARKEKYFEETNFVNSKLDREESLLIYNRAPKAHSKQFSEQLSVEQEASIQKMVIDILDVFGKGRFAIIEKPGANVKVAVSNEYATTMRRLSSFVVQVCNSWVAARRDGLLSPAFAETAPIVAKSSFAFSGAKREADRQAILDVIAKGAGKTMRVALISEGEDRAKMQGKILDVGRKGKLILVLDALHNWQMRQVMMLVDIAHRIKKEALITHIVTLSHANTVSCSVGSSVSWDLTEVGFRVENLALPEADSGFALQQPGLPDRWLPPGERSQNLFTREQREQQLKYNEDLLVFSQNRQEAKSKDKNALADALREVPSNAKPSSVLVLFARNTTQQRIRGWIASQKFALLRERSPAVIFVNYFKLKEVAPALSTVSLTVLADIGYTGAARPTFQHINTVLEKTTKKVLILAKQSAFKKVYFDNGSHTDRSTYHLSRLPYLKNELEKKLFDSKYCDLSLLSSSES